MHSNATFSLDFLLLKLYLFRIMSNFFNAKEINKKKFSIELILKTKLSILSEKRSNINHEKD